MFEKLKLALNERRARAAIDAAGPIVARNVAGISLPERAAVMIIAHAMLRDATLDYGQAVIVNPMRMVHADVVELLARLGVSHRKLTASLTAVSDHVAGDIVYSGTLRQIRATEVMIVTLGMAYDKALVAPARQIWKSLWASRFNAVDGVRLIKEFERAMHERALPASQPSGPEKMARLATSLPAMFRPKKPVEGASAPAAGGSSAAKPPPRPVARPNGPAPAAPARRPAVPPRQPGRTRPAS